MRTIKVTSTGSFDFAQDDWNAALVVIAQFVLFVL